MNDEPDRAPGIAVLVIPMPGGMAAPTDTFPAMIAWLYHHGGPRTGEVLTRLERHALPLLERAVGAPVEGMVGEEDPFEAVSSALRDRGFDEVIISTLHKRVSEWLRRDLPHRIETLGVLVTTVSQSEEREAPAAPAGVRM